MWNEWKEWEMNEQEIHNALIGWDKFSAGAENA
jgi:hypothetical protein